MHLSAYLLLSGILQAICMNVGEQIEGFLLKGRQLSKYLLYDGGKSTVGKGILKKTEVRKKKRSGTYKNNGHKFYHRVLLYRAWFSFFSFFFFLFGESWEWLFLCLIAFSISLLFPVSFSPFDAIVFLLLLIVCVCCCVECVSGVWQV